MAPETHGTLRPSPLRRFPLRIWAGVDLPALILSSSPGSFRGVFRGKLLFLSLPDKPPRPVLYFRAPQSHAHALALRDDSLCDRWPCLLRTLYGSERCVGEVPDALSALVPYRS